MLRNLHSLSRKRPRGTILIVALLVLAFIAFVLGSYINLNLTTARLADRSYCSNVAFNLAETGAEEALWSFNQAAGGSSTAWSEWHQSGTAAWKKFTGFDISPGTTGAVKVYVDNTSAASGGQPKVVALGMATPFNAEQATKMIEITLRRRSLFAGGLVARESVSFLGTHPSVDSWDSDPDHNPATPPVPYSAGVRKDGGGVASSSVLDDAAMVNQADVWGYVATGGAPPQVGGGSIRGADTPPGVVIDPKRVSADFVANLPAVTAPADGTPIPAITSSMTLGTPGSVTKWRCPHIALAGKDTLTVEGDVTLVLTGGPGTNVISVTGKAGIDIAVGATLTLYVEGDVLIAGNGIANANAAPVSCVIWGSNHSAGGQDLKVAGNGVLKAAIYAPNGKVTLNGNGDMEGSVVADRITLTGNAAFHYDESLGDYGTTTPYGVGKWRELTTQEDRQPYQAVFAGW